MNSFNTTPINFDATINNNLLDETNTITHVNSYIRNNRAEHDDQLRMVSETSGSISMPPLKRTNTLCSGRHISYAETYPNSLNWVPPDWTVQQYNDLESGCTLTEQQNTTYSEDSETWVSKAATLNPQFSGMTLDEVEELELLKPPDFPTRKTHSPREDLICSTPQEIEDFFKKYEIENYFKKYNENSLLTPEKTAQYFKYYSGFTGFTKIDDIHDEDEYWQQPITRSKSVYEPYCMAEGLEIEVCSAGDEFPSPKMSDKIFTSPCAKTDDNFEFVLDPELLKVPAPPPNMNRTQSYIPAESQYDDADEDEDFLPLAPPVMCRSKSIYIPPKLDVEIDESCFMAPPQMRRGVTMESSRFVNMITGTVYDDITGEVFAQMGPNPSVKEIRDCLSKLDENDKITKAYQNT